MYAVEIINRFLTADALVAYDAGALYPVERFKAEQVVFYLILRSENVDDTIDIVHPCDNDKEKSVKENNAHETDKQL